MIIRVEKTSEFPEIYRLVKDAFATARVSDGTEQDFVDRLRAGKGYIPELALVAEEKGEIIGHVMLTRQEVETANSVFEGLLLAPLAVKESYRNRKIGTKLVNEALQKAIAAGHKAVFLVGDPKYYGRFGFQSAAKYRIDNTNGIPSQYVLVKELQLGSLADVNGRITFAV